MATMYIKDAVVKVGATSATTTDFSDHVSSVQITRSYEELDVTALGDLGRKRKAGLENSTITLTFFQDFAASSVNAIIEPLLGGTGYIEVLPSGATASATNPKYSATVSVLEWTPLKGGVGEMATVDATFPVFGVVTKALS